MSVRPRGNSWQAAVSFKGQRARADFPTREEAERWHADALAALMNGRPVPPSTRKPGGRSATGGTTLRDALNATERGRWAGTKAAKESILKAQAVLRYFGPERAIESITTADIARMQQDLTRAGDSPATVNRKVSALGAMMRQVEVDSNYRWTMPRFPERKEEPEGRSAVLDEEQVGQVEAWLRRAGDHEAADAVALLFWTGLRVGEMERLRWMDVTTPQAGRPFLKVIGTKNGENRDVPVVKEARAILDRRRKEWEESKASPMHPYLNRKGARVFPALRPVTVLRQFQRACRLLGIEGDDLCLHTLRHSCGTHLKRRGLSDSDIMKWLGHKTHAMMRRYARITPTDLARAADLLDGGVAA